MERILYLCPKCGAEYKNVTNGNFIECSACGNKVEWTEKGKLIPVGDSVAPERVDLWYDLERAKVREKVKDENFMLTHNVALFIEKPEVYNYRFITLGVATLDKENVTFKSTIDERPKKIITEYGVGKFKVDFDYSEGVETVEEEFKDLTFKISNNESIANNPGESLELYDAKHSYRIMFVEEKAATEYALAIEELYKQRKGV